LYGKKMEAKEIVLNGAAAPPSERNKVDYGTR
jgi:hypothetical protein